MKSAIVVFDDTYSKETNKNYAIRRLGGNVPRLVDLMHDEHLEARPSRIFDTT